MVLRCRNIIPPSNDMPVVVLGFWEFLSEYSAGVRFCASFLLHRELHLSVIAASCFLYLQKTEGRCSPDAPVRIRCLPSSRDGRRAVFSRLEPPYRFPFDVAFCTCRISGAVLSGHHVMSTFRVFGIAFADSLFISKIVLVRAVGNSPNFPLRKNVGGIGAHLH